MASSSSSSSSSSIVTNPPENTDNNNLSLSWISNAQSFLQNIGSIDIPLQKGFHLDIIIRNLLTVDRIKSGSVKCLLTVKPPVCNPYGTLHGGAVATVAEMVAFACARTVFVSEDKKNLFLGELAISYLSAVRPNGIVEVEGSIVKSGRNVTTSRVEFKSKDTQKLIYTARATFYSMPLANL